LPKHEAGGGGGVLYSVLKQSILSVLKVFTNLASRDNYRINVAEALRPAGNSYLVLWLKDKNFN